MMRVSLDVITMLGSDYALFAKEGAPAFPHGELAPGEPPADAARRLVKEWTGTELPKLELVDFVPRANDELALVFRAMLVSEPTAAATRHKRFELPAKVGRLEGKWVEEALKTGLNYKLTRV